MMDKIDQNQSSEEVISDDQEAHTKVKRRKRIQAVRFASDNEESDDHDDKDGAREETERGYTMAELYNMLPSRTIHRGINTFHRVSSIVNKAPSTLTVTAARRMTIRSGTMPLLRRKSSAVSVDLPLVANEDMTLPYTDEEKRAHLAAIRELPYSMREKRAVREEMLSTFTLDDMEKSTWTPKRRMTVLGNIFEFFSRFELWAKPLKKIEAQYGTGIVSYFVFLRTLLYLNVIICIPFIIFIVIPQAIFPAPDVLDEAKQFGLQAQTEKNSYLETFYDDYEHLGLLQDELSTTKVSTGDNVTNVTILATTEVSTGHNVTDVTIRFITTTLDPNITKYLVDILNNTPSFPRYNVSAMCTQRYLYYVKNNTAYGVLHLIQDLFQGTGWMEPTVMFIGHYRTQNVMYFGYVYNMPLAFLTVVFALFIICLIMMIHFFSAGIQEAVLTRKGYMSYVYSNTIFCGWDNCIVDKTVADLRQKAFVLELKSTLEEDRRRREVKDRTAQVKLKIYALRVLMNALVIVILLTCYFIIYYVAEYQLLEQIHHSAHESGPRSLFVHFLSSITITFLNLTVPLIFFVLIPFEKYHAQTEISVLLCRNVFLKLSSIVVLVRSFYSQITCDPRDACGHGLDATCRSPLCWETYVGQQLYKLVILDMFVFVGMLLFIDIPRHLLVKHWNNRFTRFIGHQPFDLPPQVLALVYSQTLCWLGVFYSPLLPVVAVGKTIVIFYLKLVTVLYFAKPSKVLHKASRSNAMFMAILMMAFFIIMFIVGYSTTSLPSSPGCSPFRYYDNMMGSVPDVIKQWSNELVNIFHFIFSALFFVPGSFLLCLAIYYYYTVAVIHKKTEKYLEGQIAYNAVEKKRLMRKLFRQKNQDDASSKSYDRRR